MGGRLKGNMGISELLLSLFPDALWQAALLFPTVMSYLTTGPKIMEPTDHRLKTLTP